MDSSAPSPLSVIWMRLKIRWKFGVVFITPIVGLIIPALADFTRISRFWYCFFIMIIYWLTHCLPAPVIAFMPIAWFPLWGVVGTKEISLIYFQDANALLLGESILMFAFYRSNLPKRFIIFVLLIFGRTTFGFQIGFLVGCFFLSMWHSNAETAFFIMNFTVVLVEEAFLTELAMMPTSESMSIVTSDVALSPSLGMMRYKDNTMRAFAIAAFYGILLGGTVMFVGSSTNLLILNICRRFYKDQLHLALLNWMVYNGINACLCSLATIVWLYIYYKKNPSNYSANSEDSWRRTRRLREILKVKRTELGRFTISEWVTVTFMFLLLILWLTRDLIFIEGWSSYLFTGFLVKDSSPTLLFATLLTIIPQKISFFCKDLDDRSKDPPTPPIVDFVKAQGQIPWGLCMLLGGGFSIFYSFEVSGARKALESQLEMLSGIPYTMFVVLSILTTFSVTLIVSNTVTAIVLLPFFAIMADVAGFNPLYVLVPVTVVASFAFLLPISGSTNSIIFNRANMTWRQTIIPGLIETFLCCLITFTTFTAAGRYLFD